jgi:hypothetical protein
MSIQNDGATPPDIDEILASIGSEDSTPESQPDAGAGDSSESETTTDDAEKGEESSTEVVEAQPMTAEDLVGHEKSLADSIFKDTDIDAAAKKVESDKEAADKAEADKVAAEKAAADKAEADKAAAEKVGGEGKPGDADKKDDKVEDPHAAALEKEVPGGAHAKESTRKDWEELRTAAKTYKQQAEEHKQQLDALAAEKAQLEEKVKSGTQELPQEVQSELELLRSRVIEFDVSLLPEIREKYDAKIQGTASAVMHWFSEAAKDPKRTYDVLDENGQPTGVKSGLTPEIIEKLNSSVGAAGFTNYNWAKWINDCLANEVITGVEARQLENTIANAMTLEQNRSIEIQQRRQNWATEQAQKQLQEQQRAAAHRENALTIVNKTKDLLEDTKQKYDWAKDPGVLPANATPEQKAAHEEKVKAFNERGVTFKKLLKTYWGSQAIHFDGADQVPDMSVDEFGSLMVNAFSADELRKEKAAVEAKLAEVQRELDEYRAGGSTAPKTGARAGGSEAAKPSATKVDFDFTPESVLASIK